MRTRASTNRLQSLYDTGKYYCTHRRYGYPDTLFHKSLSDLPIGYDYLEVKLIRKTVSTDTKSPQQD